MDVFFHANEIYEKELLKSPFLKNHKDIIDTSSILHDMCDKKYMNEKYGLNRISEYMKDKISTNDLEMSLKIISTMSYSTIKKNGFPKLNEYQLAYNIVREADLLASYDFDRCIIYQMLKNDESYEKSIIDAKNLFENRVFKYIDDGLFTTTHSKLLAQNYHMNALQRINSLNRFVKMA
jgi:glycyl-tRNA synthetase alpha subunit